MRSDSTLGRLAAAMTGTSAPTGPVGFFDGPQEAYAGDIPLLRALRLKRGGYQRAQLAEWSAKRSKAEVVNMLRSIADDIEAGTL